MRVSKQVGDVAIVELRRRPTRIDTNAPVPQKSLSIQALAWIEETLIATCLSSGEATAHPTETSVGAHKTLEAPLIETSNNLPPSVAKKPELVGNHPIPCSLVAPFTRMFHGAFPVNEITRTQFLTPFVGGKM